VKKNEAILSKRVDSDVFESCFNVSSFTEKQTLQEQSQNQKDSQAKLASKPTQGQGQPGQTQNQLKN